MENNNNVKREIIFLAGLLHDIGKFWQRADKAFADKQNELSEYSKKMANDICPVNDQGRFGYQHVVWGNEFFEKFKEKLEKVPGVKENLFQEGNAGENNLMNLAVNHHKPQTILQGIVTIADWWSAGIDRTNQNTLEKSELNTEKIEWGRKRYKSIPLYSVFNQIYEGQYKSAFPLKPLDIEHKENIFPKEINEKKDGVSENDYNALWLEFIEKFDKLPTDSLKGFTESLLFLLKKYTWCIPSNTMDMANVSLYEHLKTTAAFADCLYIYYLENKQDLRWKEENKKLIIKENTQPVIMVGGDISGIQKFIYNIASRKAAVSLKGRSFYLQLLIDSIIQRIISHEKINATLGHVVYSSGGKFYMLLPNTSEVLNALKEIKISVEEELWDKHKGKLIVNIEYIPFAYTSDKTLLVNGEKGKLKDIWKGLDDKMKSNKGQKFKHIMLEQYASFFEPQKDGGNVKVCAVTGENLSENNCIRIDKDPDKFISKAVNEQIELGNELKSADFNITYKGKSEDAVYLEKRLFNIGIAGIANHLFPKIDLTKENPDYFKITSADVSRIKWINNTDFLTANLKGNHVSYGFQFYGGNQQAKNTNGNNKTFEQLTEVISGDPESETYFGILRMDIDGLGNIFIKGLKEEHKSFSAYATMSFLLDTFFSGYINTIRNQDKYKDHVNILYSGGDDVFAVGRWDLLIDFAEDLRNEFAAFVGRQDISISGGVAIVNNKFPIAKAAEIAAKAEENAKHFTRDDGKNKNGYIGETEKNAFCFLGETVSWEEEFEYVKNKKNEFMHFILQENLSKSILHKLMVYGGIKKENERRLRENPSYIVELSYKWHTVYFLKRLMERHDKNRNIKDFIQELQKELFKERNYDLISLAARWAEQLIRIEKNIDSQ
ncbi:MAG: type III-A CRISPR-associated protein Cas10/Csm1 [Bacteroidota bacterium]